MEQKVTRTSLVTLQYPGEVAECGALACLQIVLEFQAERVKKLRSWSERAWADYVRGKKGEEAVAALGRYQAASALHISAARDYRRVSEMFELRYPETYDRGERWG